MNYMIKGIQALKESFFLGIIIYIVIFVLLYLFKKRRTISWNYMFEGIFCIYCVTLLNLTGIFTLSYSLNGPFNYNLLPFIGSSIVPILLNFALFFPLGFLLPLIFRSCRGNWKKVAIISGLISFLIELLQLFGGRYAEMEDFLINTLGGFSGYIVCTAICERKTNRRKAVVSIVTLCLTLALCLIGIYAVGDNEKQLPDGLSAVENSIAEINVYSEGEERSISIDSYLPAYFRFGHLSGTARFRAAPVPECHPRSESCRVPDCAQCQPQGWRCRCA